MLWLLPDVLNVRYSAPGSDKNGDWWCCWPTLFFSFVTAQTAGKFADEIIPIKVKGKKGNISGLSVELERWMLMAACIPTQLQFCGYDSLTGFLLDRWFWLVKFLLHRKNATGLKLRCFVLGPKLYPPPIFLKTKLLTQLHADDFLVSGLVGHQDYSRVLIADLRDVVPFRTMALTDSISCRAREISTSTRVTWVWNIKRVIETWLICPTQFKKMVATSKKFLKMLYQCIWLICLMGTGCWWL